MIEVPMATTANVQASLNASMEVVPSIMVDGSVSRANSGYIAPGQSAVKFNLDAISLSTARTVPLFICPANKNLTLTDIYISHDSTTATRVALLVGTTASNAVAVFSGPAKGDTAPISQPGMETQLNVPAGLTLFVSWGAISGANLYINIAAVLQNTGVG
jgi:hypothetical protein